MMRFLEKTREMIFARQTSLLSSTIIISVMVIVSRLFGFMRYRIFASYFTKEELDIFFAAFRIPDLIFEILITGALTTSLIPFYIRYQKNKELQDINISSIMNVIMIVLLGSVVILTFLLPYIMAFITPGFPKEKIDQIVSYSQILLIGQLPFFIFGTFLTGISQARKVFLIPSLAPIIYNVAIIIFTFFFAHSLYLLAPVLGVVVGAFLFFVIQLPVLAVANLEYKFLVIHKKVVIEFFRIAIPRIVTVIVAQIEATIDLTLTSLIAPGAYTVFYLAQHLQLLPVSVLGIAFGQASLPYLTELYQENRLSEFREIIVKSILNLFFFTIPIMGILIFARTPIVRFFFGGDKFDWNATVSTAVTLSFFALSIPFHSVYYFITRCFYALFDSKTPFYISVVSISINALLSLYLVVGLKLPVWSLAFSFSTAITFQVILLLILLYKRIHGFSIYILLRQTTKMALVAAIASFFSYYVEKLLDGLILDTSRTINVFLLLIITATIYFSLYFFLAWVFNISEIAFITKIVGKMKYYQKRIFEVYTSP